MLKLNGGRIPEGKRVTCVGDPFVIPATKDMGEKDVEEAIRREASGEFNAYVSKKGPDPRIGDVDRIYFVTPLQLEDRPDYAGRIRGVYERLSAGLKETKRNTAEGLIRTGGVLKMLRILRKEFPEELRDF